MLGGCHCGSGVERVGALREEIASLSLLVVGKGASANSLPH